MSTAKEKTVQDLVSRWTDRGMTKGKIIELAFDAGRTAGIEDAATKARELLDESGFPARANTVAAEIRKLKGD